MTYIKQHQRHQIDEAVNNLREALAKTTLDDETVTDEEILSYAIERLLMTIYGTRNHTSISDITSAIGLLEVCKLELYRQVGVPQQDQSIYDNGMMELDVSVKEALTAIHVNK